MPSRTNASLEKTNQSRKSRPNSRSNERPRLKSEYPKKSGENASTDLYNRKYNKLKAERRSRSPDSASYPIKTSPKNFYTNYKPKQSGNKNHTSHQSYTQASEQSNHTRQTDSQHSKQENTPQADADPDAIIKKEEPNFKSTGLLASEDANQNGILLKHTPPIDSRKPDKMWRLYMFKKAENQDDISSETNSKIFHIHRNPTYLFGKDARVADIPLYHATISKQHAVLQFRLRNNFIRPYLIDLESTNGSFLNDEKIEPCRYYELREEDVIRFGNSTREFILLNTDSVEVKKKDYKSYLDELDKH